MAKAKAKGKKKAPELPVFRNDEEERRFWDTHSAADYWDQMRPVRVEVSKSFRARVKTRKSG